jgi:hypothetical protein
MPLNSRLERYTEEIKEYLFLAVPKLLPHCYRSRLLVSGFGFRS